ncbi:MAG TPA: hypothetical protein VHT03_00090 [Rhizomicrobium sp.]|jgi:hypothetical protein|nr:hypothetical protein [Rhizomicrobium sp.]
MRLLLLSLLVLFAAASASPLAAAGDPYTVSGIKVDASAQSAIEAQTKAINSGRAKAWQTLYRRLTKQQDWGRQPTLDDATLQRLVRSYQARDQRSSTTRFVANMTYVFNANAVRRVLQQKNLAYADVTARPILVIPLAPGWSDQTPWTQAWKDSRFAHGAVPLVLPLSDSIDEDALASLHFDSAAWKDVEALASHVHAGEAYLVLVIPQHAQMVVKIRHLGGSSGPLIPDLTVPVPPNTPAAKAFGEVADAAANAITDSWKSRSVVDFSKHSTLVASVHVDTLEQWAQTLDKIEAISTVTNVDLLAMDIGEARIAISYAGSPDQLSEQLSHAGLTLANDDGQWRLSHSDSGTAP